MVLGFEIAANFGDCTINRQQRLVPFQSMPKPQKSKWGNDIRNMHRNCVMQLPLLLLSHLQLSSPPPSLSSALRCMMQLPLLSHLQLSSAWCSFLSSSLICSSPLLHLTPLLLSSSALHCVMQLLLLLSHLQLSSPPLSTAWCKFLSSAALLRFSSPPYLLSSISLLSTAWCSFLSSHPQLSSISPLPISLSCAALHCVMQLPILVPHLQLSSPPSNSSAALLWSPQRDAASSPL